MAGIKSPVGDLSDPSAVAGKLPDSQFIPIGLLVLGSYLTWFGVHYWRDTAQKWPSDPVKAVLTGKGVPAAQPSPTARSVLTQNLVSATAVPTVSAGGAAGAAAGRQAAGGWDPCRCSSYWGTGTASGRPMSATTIASPYLPIGTQVSVAFNGRQVAGVVEDFGPADWVLRADPQRFLDLAEPLMAQLTGQRANLITAQYQVTVYGSGSVYRPNHPRTLALKQRWGG